MVRKPSIARKIHQNTYNFIFFANFGGKRGLLSIHQAYVRGINNMQLACVRRLLVKEDTCTIQKMVF
jgi:hypothetical protein